MLRPQVDVGVVTWNTAELTATALRRLLDSDQGCDIRLLVHDNASNDGTPAALAAAVPEAEVEVGEENLGFARAVNRLLGRSRAPWFLALNSDAWPEPGALARLVATAHQHPRAAAVAPLLLRPDGSVEHSTHPFPSLAVAAIDAVGGRSWLPPALLERRCLESAWGHDRPRSVDWAVGAALLMRREAVTDVGGFDERFFMYVEDLAWCWQARRRGWEVRFDPAAVVRHVGNASGARRFGDGRQALEEANLRVLLRQELGTTRAAVYTGLQVVAAGRAAAAASSGGRPEEAARWKQRLRVLAGVVPVPSPHASLPSGLVQAGPGEPEVSVVVPTHNRADRLERLVRALERQSLSWRRFEVVVVDDGSDDATVAVLDRMVAASPMDLRVLRQEQRGPAAARNAGWRATRGPVVAFTDDDCVPATDWLERGLAASGGAARAIVGRTRPPADQVALEGLPFARAMRVEDPRFLETCNVFYRRVDLQAVGGFDERFRRPSGEDTHLGLRMQEAGIHAVFCDDVVVEHDVRPGGLAKALREAARWADLPLVLQGRPGARRLAHRWLFWKPTHPRVILAAVAVAAGTRWRPALVLAGPWLAYRLCDDPVCHSRAGRVVWLPGALALDLWEVAVMVRGSVRHRTILL